MYRSFCLTLAIGSVACICAGFGMLDCAGSGGAGCCCTPVTDVKPTGNCATTCAPGTATCSGTGCGAIVSGGCNSGLHTQSCTLTTVSYSPHVWECKKVDCTLPEGGMGS